MVKGRTKCQNVHSPWTVNTVQYVTTHPTLNVATAAPNGEFPNPRTTPAKTTDLRKTRINYGMVLSIQIAIINPVQSNVKPAKGRA